MNDEPLTDEELDAIGLRSESEDAQRLLAEVKRLRAALALPSHDEERRMGEIVTSTIHYYPGTLEESHEAAARLVIKDLRQKAGLPNE